MTRYNLTALDNVFTIYVGGDMPTHEHFSAKKCKDFPFPIISNGTGREAIRGYTDIPKISPPTISISARGTIGYVAYHNIAIYPTVRLLCLKIKHDDDPTFMYYAAKSLRYPMSTTVIPQLTAPMLKQIKLPKPPIDEQQQIARILSTIDKIIAHDKIIVEKLAKAMRLIYSYWFVQFNFPDENGRPYKSSGGRMVYNKQLKQEIPEGWEVKRMIDLFDFERGTEVGSGQYTDNKLNDNYVKFYRVRDVGDDSSTWVSTNNDLRIVHPGDVVITLDGTVGKIGVDIDGAISGGLRHVVDHNKLISNGMIWAILQSYYVQESLRRYVSGRGSILAHAGGAINDLQTPYDKQTFINFQNIINPMFELMAVCSSESKLLTSLRDWLLPMLMNGQARVNASKEQNNEN